MMKVRQDFERQDAESQDVITWEIAPRNDGEDMSS